jgi:ATP-dependent Zn protease
MWQRYAAAVPVVGELDLEEAADRSGGMTGADIEAAVMVALGLSLVDGVDALAQPYLTEALLRQHHVEERPKPTVDQLRRTAVHEAGHTVWASLYWGPAVVASVSIRESDDANGRTSLSDELEDENRSSRADMWGHVAMGFAGLVAEELVYGHDEVHGGGCANDIRKATHAVRRLLGELAGSPELGAVSVETIEVGIDSDRGSERMRAELWEIASAECRRIKHLVEGALSRNLEPVETVARRLMEAPDLTLSGPELTSILSDLPLMRLPMDQSPDTPVA